MSDCSRLSRTQPIVVLLHHMNQRRNLATVAIANNSLNYLNKKALFCAYLFFDVFLIQAALLRHYSVNEVLELQSLEHDPIRGPGRQEIRHGRSSATNAALYSYWCPLFYEGLRYVVGRLRSAFVEQHQFAARMTFLAVAPGFLKVGERIGLVRIGFSTGFGRC